MSSLRLAVLLLPMLLAACNRNPPPAAAPAAAEAPAPTAAPVRDPHSYANTQAFVTQRLLLDLEVDFTRRQLAGSAELRLKRLDPQAAELVLDTRALEVSRVEAASGDAAWAAAPHRLDPADPLFGSALRIAMPAGADRVRVHYRTSPEASGLQWLTPAQTAGKQKPFLFSQSQSIHARSWVPLQDTPSVRAPYEAHIRTPRDLLAVMSADNEPGTPRDGDYRFAMPQPIPSYLLALAVGDLQFAATGPRTGVYAEPVTLAGAAKELEDTEAMVTQAEALYGPYRWGRYDLLILPPSFPYGGMENPRLTFATPTILAGDKSLVALVAHELAHSWSGNLVTNATWRDFWLNESFTTYLTHRIMEAVYGVQRADMERALDADELKRDLPEVPEAERMLAPATLADPEETHSVVVYNRGALLLYNLEQTFGRAAFDAFLKSWFDQHAFTSQTTESFVAFLDQRLLSQHPGKLSLEQARAAIYQAALPAGTVYPQSDEFRRVDEARSAWLAGQRKADALGAAQWNVLHWAYFLDNLPATLSQGQLGELDDTYHFSDSGNHVLLKSWLPVAIEHGYRPADAAVHRHLTSVGRMLLIRPVYRALVKTDTGRKRAQEIYAEARPGYHPIAQTAVDRIFAEAPAQPATELQ